MFETKQITVCRLYRVTKKLKFSTLGATFISLPLTDTIQI